MIKISVAIIANTKVIITLQDVTVLIFSSVTFFLTPWCVEFVSQPRILQTIYHKHCHHKL